ncbi:MAG: hypothetical protein WBB30_06245 [Solirubrobacterales bacterium]
MEVLIAIVVVALVALFVTVPLRRSQGPAADRIGGDAALATLEVRKQAKYREIRDTEMDRAQGKITAADFQLQDGELRAEAIAILKEIEEIEEIEGIEAAAGKPQPARDSEGDDGRASESV